MQAPVSADLYADDTFLLFDDTKVANLYLKQKIESSGYNVRCNKKVAQVHLAWWQIPKATQK